MEFNVTFRSRHIPEALNVYDLAQNTLKLGTETISRSFGVVDMYKDTSHAKDAYHIEKSLSRLEEAASKVISKLEMERSQGLITLLRSEVNILRKFLFVMSFRNSLQHRSWVDETLDPDTLAMLKEYAKEHGLASTGDAYLHTMRHLLDTEHWDVNDNKNIFWVTRTDYKLDADGMALSLYEAPLGMEFILTENAFGIWEGIGGLPLMLICKKMGMPFDEKGSFALTRTHPVTPKLALILRHVDLMDGKKSIMGIPFGGSYYADLPFQRTEVSYETPLSPLIRPSTTMEEWTQLGRALGSRLRDRLTFRCFCLSTTHARMINSLLLENCKERITFVNIISLYKSISFAYERDPGLRQKVDYTNLKRMLVDAHRASQETLVSEDDNCFSPPKDIPAIHGANPASSSHGSVPADGAITEQIPNPGSTDVTSANPQADLKVTLERPDGAEVDSKELKKRREKGRTTRRKNKSRKT